MSVISRLARAGLALAIVVLVVPGGAWALVRWGRLDVYTSLDWSRLWTTVDDGSLVLAVITTIGWAAWALATLSLVSEVLAAATQQRWRLALPGIGVFSPASAVLVTAIVGLIAGQSVSPVSAHASPKPEPRPAPAVIALKDRAPSPALEPSAAQGRSHIVQPGDDLWSLAEHYFQDGSRWREIAAANQSVLLAATDVLQPGMVLAIPDIPATAPKPGVVVKAGDTLTGLAEEHLGGAERWPELAAANVGIVTDPDEIDVGWVLAIPAAASATGTASVVPSATQPQDEVPATMPIATGLTTCPAPRVTSEAKPWAAALPSSFGVVLAAGLAGAFAVRRRQQLALRPLGRRLPPLPEQVLGTSSALAASLDEAATQRPDDVRAATRVPLGEGPSGTLWCELERNAVTWLQGEDADDLAMATAIALTLASADQEKPLTVVAAGPGFEWLTSLDEPRLVVEPQVCDGLRILDEAFTARSTGLPEGRGLDELRADPALAEAWAPLVVILAGPPSGPLPVALSLVGISVVICGGSQPAPMTAATVTIRHGRALNTASGEEFVPHLVSAPARRVLTEIFETANQTLYPPAPWWDETPTSELPTVLRVAAWPGAVEELPVVSTFKSEHPFVKLLGPVELVGARGDLPNRAVKQCEEYCTWLLENPGASPVTMARALVVAEPTRRSNMSRLRSWLGSDDQGVAYLPDAYTGRIMLHPGVSSDWEQLQLCINGGVNRVGDAALVEALRLVRGAPLADAAPGQWHWAEQLRADIVSTIRDIGVVLGTRALHSGNLELAAWAVDRGLVAAPDDELLSGVQIRIAHASGDRAEVDRLVLQMTRRARTLGVDLTSQTVTLLQEVVEGRARLRRA